jgi:hypothetical protein
MFVRFTSAGNKFSLFTSQGGIAYNFSLCIDRGFSKEIQQKYDKFILIIRPFSAKKAEICLNSNAKIGQKFSNCSWTLKWGDNLK